MKLFILVVSWEMNAKRCDIWRGKFVFSAFLSTGNRNMIGLLLINCRMLERKERESLRVGVRCVGETLGS